MRVLALDTSVAVALLVQTHQAHPAVTRWWAGRAITLSGHALVETYSVLTRLPGDLRLAPQDAARLLTERFGAPLLLGPEVSARLPLVLSELDIAGGLSMTRWWHWRRSSTGPTSRLVTCGRQRPTRPWAHV